jgi:peptidoglycan-associated lipoprotein
MVKIVCLLAVMGLLAGCVSLSLKRELSPKDTVVNGWEESDEFFVNEDGVFTAHGFDAQKTEYNYITSDVLEAVYFGFDSAKISPKEHAKVVEMAKIFTKNRTLRILLVGNCDKFGGEKYNLSLGQRRAEAVRDAFEALEINRDRVITASLGSYRANQSAEKKVDGAVDRRCDIVLHAVGK